MPIIMTGKKFQGSTTPLPSTDLQFEAENINLNDGESVSSWQESNSGLVISQSDGSKQPIYRTSRINGLPSVEFDGVDDGLFNTVAEVDDHGLTFALVGIKNRTNNGTGFTIHQSDLNSNMVGIRIQNNQVQAMSYPYGDFRSVSSGITIPNGSAFYTIVRYNTDGTFQVWYDGSFRGTQNIGNNENLTKLSVGGFLRPANVAHYKGEISEILIYRSELTNSDVTDLSNYITNKYNL